MADWKTAIKESPITGKSHPDTFTVYNDIQLLKMQFSGDVLPQVKAIEVYHDNSLVFGYEFFYQNNVQVGHHIGMYIHQDVRCERFDLQPGEYIVRMGGRLGDICDQISFTTSAGRTLAAGG